MSFGGIQNSIFGAMKDIKTHCVTCERDTTQKVLFLKKVKNVDEFDASQIEQLGYMTIECAGCKSVSFLIRETIEDLERPGKMTHIDSNYPEEENDLYPEFYFIDEEDQHCFPSSIFKLYEEIKSAFESGSNIAAGVCLRTLVEAVCKQQNVTGRNLQEK